MKSPTRKLPPPNMTDYEKARKEFKIDVPEYFNFGFDVVDRWAEDRTKLALEIAGEMGERLDKYTFYEIKVLSNRFANVMRERGLKKGDRVLVMLPWLPQWYIAMIGMIKLGVIPIPSTTLLTPRDIRYRVNESEAVGIITDIPDAPKVEEAMDEAAVDCFVVKPFTTEVLNKKLSPLFEKLSAGGEKTGFFGRIAAKLD